MPNLNQIVGTAVCLLNPSPRPVRRDERGLSQSTENAILLAGAVAIAMVVIKVITDYVTKRLPH